MSDLLTLVLLVLLLGILYRYIIPFLFPTVVHGVSLIKPNSDSDEVYAFQGGKVPFVNTEKRSHAKAIRRRKNNIYAAAGA